ncbi:maltase 2-like [Lycorma delicatula]|uniref:maltase 2-like n=1 Tax=Lycorma delicatula TaxID=130591 RepID=UPI003F518B68
MLSIKNNYTNLIYTLILLLNINYINCKWKVWNKDLDWWQTTVIYQIYPLSFQDSDGDGKGDLKGIESRLDYFVETGIKTIWISPIYKSPQFDLGYDISNYMEIDSQFGTLDDFKSLIEAIKKRGIKILMDFVPNHTSDEHEWFQKSIKRIDPYTDYYVWKDPKEVFENGTKLPPNNWRSLFSGDGWKYVEERKQFYFHQFSIKQPDLNFFNPEVRKEMKDVLKYWLDLGVDGFRVDAVKHLMEDPEFHDESCLPGYKTCEDYFQMFHNYTTDWPTTYDMVYEWREFMDSYVKNVSDKHTRILLIESYTSIDYVMEYYGNSTHLGAHMPFNFFLVLLASNELNSTIYKYIIDTYYNYIPDGSWGNWVTGNHDNKRVATRMGDDAVDAFNMLLMLMPGTPVTYQGEELGQSNNKIRKDQIRDPNNNGGGSIDVRDPERGPFLWDNTQNAGFTNKKIPWEPIHPSYWKINLETQKNSTRSHYSVYKRLVELRNRDTFQRGDIKTYDVTTWVFVFTRSLPGNETYVTVINFGSEREVVLLGEFVPKLPEKLSVVVSSINSGYNEGDVIETKLSLHVQSKVLILRPKAAVVLVTHVNVINPTTQLPNITTDPSRNKTANSANSLYGMKNNSSLLFLLAIIFLLRQNRF